MGQPPNNLAGQSSYPTPGQSPYPQQGQSPYSSPPTQQSGGQLFSTPMPPSTQLGDSGYSRPQYRSSEPPPSVLDGVTIALAVLAFISVACLIPLYVVVFNALGS
jgi:hypothetical protein